jgi:REP element-mobilizing transposase RayT
VAQASLPASIPLQAGSLRHGRKCRQGCLRYFSMLSGRRTRGYLPHLSVEGATYFVTFRLAGSLPHDLLASLKERRDDLMRRAAADPQGPADRERHPPFSSFADEVDSLLDQSTGELWLGRPEIASLVASALQHFAGQRYQLRAWCVMPNHVHAVLRPLGTHTLDSILHSWKSFTANEANRMLDRRGRPFWQPESYDHWIREDVELSQCCRYIEDNPVKSGLCERPEDWPWSSASRRDLSR